MMPLVLYCKSYKTDLKRLIRLAQSVETFNVEKIPFYVSVPSEDYQLFAKHLSDLNVNLLRDEQILLEAPNFGRKKDLPDNLLQQVVKSEFWRLNISKSYLCLDSDAIFIRPFYQSDYLHQDLTPYTVITEAHDLLEMAMQLGKDHVLENFRKEAIQVQSIFKRSGKPYSFGPMPMVWDRAVWESLEKNYLSPRKMSLADAIEMAPLESRWYGEAMFAYKAIAIYPCEPFFKVFHYAWQFDNLRKANLKLDALASMYSGVIFQSSWEREMDWPVEQGSAFSKINRRVKRVLGRL